MILKVQYVLCDDYPFDGREVFVVYDGEGK